MLNGILSENWNRLEPPGTICPEGGIAMPMADAMGKMP